ncbi:MAG: serine/threonine-protein kinase [Pseudomonadota bacterium]
MQPTSIFVPHWFGDYELLRHLGTGGMAEVYLARTHGAQGFEKIAVIKRLLGPLAAQPRFVEMFITEAKTASGLQHANVVQTLSLGQEGRQPFIVLEYVHGADLLQVLKRAQARSFDLPVDFTLHCFVEMLKGLGFAHAAPGPDGKPLGLVHRDVTPANIYVAFSGEVKLGDFGVSHGAGDEAGHELRGKYGYLAPEILQHLEVDQRADVFAAGVSLWETLAGQRLFTGRTDVEVLVKVRGEEAPPPSNFNPRIAPDIDRIVQKALVKDRDKRFQSAQELEEALSDFLFARRLRWNRRRIGDVMSSLFPFEALPLVLPPPLPRGQVGDDDWGDFTDNTSRILALQMGGNTAFDPEPPASWIEPMGSQIETDPGLGTGEDFDFDIDERAPPEPLVQLLGAGDQLLGEVKLEALVDRLAKDDGSVRQLGLVGAPHIPVRRFGEACLWDTVAAWPPPQGPPRLEISLAEVSLTRVLYEASLRRLSGLLRIENATPDQWRELYLKEGRLLYVASSRHKDGLPALMLRIEDQRARRARLALNETLTRLVPIDVALLRLPDVDVEAQRRDLGALLRSRLYPCFAWPHARVRVFPEAPPPVTVHFRIASLPGLLTRAIRRTFTLEELKANLVPRGQRLVNLRDAKASHIDALRLRPDELAVVRAIDGERSLPQVILSCGAVAHDAQQRALAVLYVLAETGIVNMA